MAFSLPNHEPIAPSRIRALRKDLLAWFRAGARDLPWRRERTPYRVWVSEVMLQQTRVETVIPYFERFMAAFPTVEALAAAHIDRVLKLWEGLGYYSRARSLHKAAGILWRGHGGELPRSAAALRELPGVGPYTAGAIASIAFGEPAAAVDGNVIRVFSRVFDIEDCVDDADVRERIWELAREVVDPKEPGAFNEALMELGAMVCVPRAPRCESCPLARRCDGRARGLVGELPVRKPRKAVPHKHIVAAAIREGSRYLLGKRPEGKMLAGLWEFPGGKVEAGEAHSQALARELQEELEIEARVGRHLGSVDHAFTHFRMTMHLYECEIVCGTPHPHSHSELRWVERREFEDLAFPVADIKLFPMVP